MRSTTWTRYLPLLLHTQRQGVVQLTQQSSVTYCRRAYTHVRRRAIARNEPAAAARSDAADSGRDGNGGAPGPKAAEAKAAAIAEVPAAAPARPTASAMPSLPARPPPRGASSAGAVHSGRPELGRACLSYRSVRCASPHSQKQCRPRRQLIAEQTTCKQCAPRYAQRHVRSLALCFAHSRFV